MFNPDFIFITISLAALIGIAFWMQIPRASIPLGIIYMAFILLNMDSLDTQQGNDIILISDKKTNQSSKRKIDNLSKKHLLISEIIKPQPLIFDSGRTNKSLIIDEKTVDVPQVESVQNIKDTDEKKDENSLELRDIQICKSIENRIPVGTALTFNNNVDTLYCYTRIKNTGIKQWVVHVWYYNNKMMNKINYNIKKSNIYRSWTRKTNFLNQVGQWRVEILDSKGRMIGSKKFKIIKAS